MNFIKKISAFFAALILLIPGFFAFADTATASPMPGQQVFDVAPAIPQAVSQGRVSSLGIGLWCALLLLLAAGLAYLAVNVYRRHKLALSQSSLIRPKLIISEGGKKKPDFIQKQK